MDLGKYFRVARYEALSSFPVGQASVTNRFMNLCEVDLINKKVTIKRPSLLPFLCTRSCRLNFFSLVDATSATLFFPELSSSTAAVDSGVRIGIVFTDPL